MSDDPTSTDGPIKRYHARRVARWRKYGKTQRRRRLLVGGLAATFVFMATIAILCAGGIEWAPLLWLVACAVGFPLTNAVTIVSDECASARRDQIRARALDMMGVLMMFPIGYLIVGSILTHGKDEHMAYAGGLMVLTALVTGGFIPAMHIAWNDPDSDFADSS